MNKLEELLRKANMAKNAAKAELLRRYPAGSEICFTIMHGQRNASTGTVVGAGWSEGYLNVEHHEAKPNSRNSHRQVHYSHVL